jgi:glucans biosynthesis protein
VEKTRDKPMERMTREPLSLRLAPRCGAKTRQGTGCMKPSLRGKIRCRLHGGGAGSGAPCGARNGNYRHGLHTAEAIRERRAFRAMLTTGDDTE